MNYTTGYAKELQSELCNTWTPTMWIKPFLEKLNEIFSYAQLKYAWSLVSSRLEEHKRAEVFYHAGGAGQLQLLACCIRNERPRKRGQFEYGSCA